MRKTIDILGIPIDYITMGQALERVDSFLLGDRAHAIYTPNSEILMDAYKNPGLKAMLSEADLLVADGAGVVLASKLLGLNLPEKVSGIDITKRIFAMSKDRNTRFFFFGGKPGIAEAARDNILKEYPGIHVVGTRDGYFSGGEEKEIIDKINKSGADILLVALGAPKQEMWIHKHKPELKVKVCIGIGGSFDIFAGKATLAPEFMRRNGLEWLYRLCKEPWRYKRMLKLPKFVLTVLGKRIKGN